MRGFLRLESAYFFTNGVTSMVVANAGVFRINPGTIDAGLMRVLLDLSFMSALWLLPNVVFTVAYSVTRAASKKAQLRELILYFTTFLFYSGLSILYFLLAEHAT